MTARLPAVLLVAASLFAGPPAHAQDAPSSAATAPAFATTPINKPDGSRWRIGYLESGVYSEYPLTLGSITHALQGLDWLQLPGPVPDESTGEDLWKWLAENATSDYIEFVPDAYWRPGNFDQDQRQPVREAITQRIQQHHDLDLLLAMGTWAGQDMRHIGPPLPTVVASTSDPVATGIVDSAMDSGRDNLHARVEPERYQRQLRLFREIVPFNTLGLVYEDSEAGRSYAALSAVQQVGAELGFDVVHCHAQSSNISQAAAVANAVDCYQQLAKQHVGAVYVTTHQGVTAESIVNIAEILRKARIPSFSMGGSREVKNGVLLSLAQADMSYVGLFHAETMARIFHGAQPRQLSQLWIDPAKIALNLATARDIGFDPPIEILLAADEVYDTGRPNR